MKKLNIWIHCRVSDKEENYLLDYQRDRIIDIFDELPISIIGISQEIDAGTQSHTRALDTLRWYIRKEKIDVVAVTDKTRLFISVNYYQEFKLMCDMHHVQIIDLQELDNQFQGFITNYII